MGLCEEQSTQDHATFDVTLTVDLCCMHPTFGVNQRFTYMRFIWGLKTPQYFCSYLVE